MSKLRDRRAKSGVGKSTIEQLSLFDQPSAASVHRGEQMPVPETESSAPEALVRTDIVEGAGLAPVSVKPTARDVRPADAASVAAPSEPVTVGSLDRPPETVAASDNGTDDDVVDGASSPPMPSARNARPGAATDLDRHQADGTATRHGGESTTRALLPVAGETSFPPAARASTRKARKEGVTPRRGAAAGSGLAECTTSRSHEREDAAPEARSSGGDGPLHPAIPLPFPAVPVTLKTPRKTDLSKLQEKYSPKLTYEWLQSHCKGKANAARNTAFVRGLQSHLGRSAGDDASCDLEDDATVDGYLDKVGRSANRKSALGYLLSIIREPAKRGFAELVREAIVLRTKTGGSMATLAREIGVDRSTLWCFANDESLPGEASRAALRALERISQFEEGLLTQHIASWNNKAFIFRERYFDLENTSYSFRQTRTPIPQLPANAIPQVRAFFEFKTCNNVTQRYRLEDGSERQLVRKGKWTRGMNPRAMPKDFEEWSHFAGASMTLAVVSKVVAELRDKPADSLAAVLDVKAVEQLLEREVQLSGCYNNGHENQIATIKQLLHPKHGFLVQLPEVFEPEARRLGIEMGDLPWAEFVASCHAQVKLLPSKLAPNMPGTSRATRSRDKKRKLYEILSLDDAYRTVVCPTLQRMCEERPPASARESVKLDFEIKYLTMALFAVCPMRVSNWGFAEWGKNLRQRNGQWWVHIPKNELKNRSSIKADFSFVLPDWTSAIVDHYHQFVKERMAIANPDAEKLVLAGPHLHRGRVKRTPKYRYNRVEAGARVYKNIHSRMAAVTKQLWNLKVAPHDWRDIYATDYLNKHPNEILIVAAVLNDKLETVLKMYAQPDPSRLSRLAAQRSDADWAASRAEREAGR